MGELEELLGMTLKSDTGPFAIVPEWLLSVGLSSRAIHLYVVLSRFADRKDEAWPLRGTLAERLGCTMKSVDRATAELKKAQAVSVQARKDKHGQKSNLYTIHRVIPRGSILSPPMDTSVAPPGHGCRPEREPGNEIQVLRTCEAQAHELVGTWWKGQNPRPAQPYIAVVKVVERALKGGWEPEVLSQALNEVATVSGSTLDYWRNRDRTKSKTPTEKTHENIRRFLARDDGEAGSDGSGGAYADELGPHRAS